MRDGDYGAFAWYPTDEVLDRWMALYHELTTRNGAQADAGRRLKAWARAAGFESVVETSSNWTFQSDEERAWWGGLWADRVRYSRIAEQAVEYGLSDTDELERIAEAWLRWADSDDAVIVIPHVEILARG